MTRTIRTIAHAARTALAWAAFPFALVVEVVAVLFTREG